MSSYRSPDFLTNRDEPLFRLRCPVHGFIHFSENERQVIDHPLFRRLRYIRQLALTEFVYPGASHTRFEHSLGVMEVATKAFDTLAAKRGDLLEATFKRVAGFEDRPLAKARQVLRLAALLHDVGHASFSHAAEQVVYEGIGHEALSIKVVRDSKWLGRLLNKLFWSGCAERVAQIIEGSPKLPPQLQVLKNLTSGEMDADRTDYLLRDSHHCGVDYGRFDYKRMIECLELQEDSSGALEIALHRDGIHTFEALILARYQMSTQVYYHRLRRIYDQYLIRYHQALGRDLPDTAEKVLANNDITMMARIMRDAEREKGERQNWARRIRDRIHYRVIHETGVNATVPDIQRSKQLLEQLQQQYPNCEFILDTAFATIHKLLTPTDSMDIKRISLALISADGIRREVAFESQVLQYIPRQFQCARIFADIPRGKKGLREKTRKFAAHKWQKLGGN